MDSEEALTAWQVGYVGGDRSVSLVPGRSMLAPLVCADPKIFVQYAPDPETTIACFLLNTPAQIANVLATPLKAQNIGLAEEVLRGEYPDCDVGIQSTLFDVRKGIRGR